MIQEQDIVVFQGRGDERLALGQSISHPEYIIKEVHLYDKLIIQRKVAEKGLNLLTQFH